MATTEVNLGSIISDTRVRRIAWASFLIVGLIIGALSVWYQTVGEGTVPEWVQGALNVMGYLSVPFSGLALANVGTPVTEVEAVDVALEDEPINEEGDDVQIPETSDSLL